MFIRHTSCERCGSSDARALYKGGSSFCFSCRRNSPSNISPYVFDGSLFSNSLNEEEQEFEKQIQLPSDVGFNYPEHCLSWVFKYGVSVNELIKNKVYWSEEKQQLIFTFYGNEGELVLWQARNFGYGSGKHGNGARTKYFTKGKPEQVLPIYQYLGSSVGPLVIVEDCISAIKCSRQASAMPVLGSSMSAAKLTRLSHLPGLSRAIVWLDGNMYDKAQAIAKKLEMLGIEARAVYTELDPKCLSDTEIVSVLDIDT